LRLEEENRAMSEIEVYEMLRLMRNKRSKISSYNAMPCWSFALVELCILVVHGIRGGERSYGLLDVHSTILGMY
jgi:hypothetical protein